MRRLSMAALLCCAAWLVGCGAELEVQMTAREVAGDADAVLAAAASVLRQDFDRWSIDRAARKITTEPAEYTTRSDSGSSRDLVKGQSTMRRTGTLIVAARGGRTLVKVRVDRERLDTSRRESSEPPAYRLSDAPGSTPIERDSARTETQNQYWVSAGRDARIERFVLDELERLFPINPDSPPSPAASTPPKVTSDRTDTP